MKSKLMENFVKNKAFFNSEDFPAMVFHLLSIEKVRGEYKAKGSIEIKEVRKIIEIPFEVNKSANGEKLLKSASPMARSSAS